MSVMVALWKETLEQWRTYRLLAVVVVLGVFGLLSPLIAKLTPELVRLVPGGEQLSLLVPPPTMADAVAQYVKNIGQFGVILALLLTMGAVAQEKDKGTAAMVLVKPLARSAFLVGKFAALGITFASGLAVAGLGCYYYALLIFGRLSVPGWVALNGLLLVHTLVYVALTLLCSTFSRSQAMAGGAAVGLLVVSLALGAFPPLGRWLPGSLLAWGTRLALAQAGDAAWGALWVSMGIVASSLVGAWLIFRRQEL